MKKLIAIMVIFVISGVLGCSVAWSATSSIPPVTLELKQTDVSAAVKTLFKGTGLNYAFESGAATGTISSLSFKDVPFDQALRSLLKTAGLVYRIDGNIYLISKKSDAAQQPGAHFDPRGEQGRRHHDYRDRRRQSALELCRWQCADRADGLAAAAWAAWAAA